MMDGLTSGSILYDVKAFKKELKFDVSLLHPIRKNEDDEKVAATSVCIQCKNLVTKDAYSATLSQKDLKNIAFHNSVKGYFNRLRTALACSDPELRCLFWYYTTDISSKKQEPSQGDCMALLLQQRTKFDDDLNWVVSLKPVAIKMTEKLGERLEDIVSEVQNTQEKFRTRLSSVVEQVREKFSESEKDILATGDRMDQVEQIVKKLYNKVKEHQSILDAQKLESEKVVMELSKVLTDRQQKVLKLRAELEQLKRLRTKRAADVDKKLVRWKQRREFSTQHDYISYVTTMLDKWDQRQGRVYVFVKEPKGKAATKVGLMGVPVKWTINLCWIRWAGQGPKDRPESYEWDALDVFFPESAYYHPRFPMVR